MNLMDEEQKEKVFGMITNNIIPFNYESLILTEEKLNRKT